MLIFKCFKYNQIIHLTIGNMLICGVIITKKFFYKTFYSQKYIPNNKTYQIVYKLWREIALIFDMGKLVFLIR